MAVTYEAMPSVRWLADALVPEGVDHEGWRDVFYREEADIENRIIPNNTLKFNDAVDTPVPNPGVQLVASSTVFIQWFQVPAIIDANGIPQLPGQLGNNHANCQGHINSETFFGAASFPFSPARDRDDISRPSGSAPDVGAYEYH